MTTEKREAPSHRERTAIRLQESEELPAVEGPADPDAVSKVRSPWRRFFARYLDSFIYSTLWGVFLLLAFNVNVSARGTGGDILDGIVALLMMIFLEPAMLSLFGTTPGKWLLGLGVTGRDGRRLTYGVALSRTWTMFCRGMGLSLPIYNLVRLWKSYRACEEWGTLDWEYESTVTLKDEKAWRAATYVGAYAVLIGILVLSVMVAELPKNLGDITVAEFSENYNRLADYYGIDTLSHLDAEGKWVKEESAGYVVSFGGYEEPLFLFSEENGIMTGMHFSAQMQGSNAWGPSYQNERVLSILAFVRAQKGSGLRADEVKRIIEVITESPFEDFFFSVYGVSITWDVEYSGYMAVPSMGMLLPEEGAEASCSFSFSMEKQ